MTENLTTACDLTEQVIACLREGELDKITAIEADRQKILNEMSEADPKLLSREKLELLLSLNQQAEKLMRSEKERIVINQSKINNAQRATQAYKKNM